MREGGATKLVTEVDAIRSPTPTVYVPRRFRLDGIEGIQTGAAIVGTPQGDGMVAIEVEAEPGVEPQPEVWSSWAAGAAKRHVSDDEEVARRRQTRLVSEAALVPVGQWVGGEVLIDDSRMGAELSRWIQAGRADYVVERPFPHQA
jgi:hypothetical protein